MSDENQNPPIDENHVIAERREKLKALRAASANGIAFPNDYRPEHDAAQLLATHGAKSKEAFEAATHIDVKVAGRIMLKRLMGKAAFATIQDASGRIQLYVTLNDIGEAAMDAFKRYDLGDIVGAEGYLFRTKTGELSIHVKAIRLITKSIRPMPEKFHGLTDTEQRYRMRYVDLMVNPEVRNTFVVRSKIVQTMREFMVSHGYLEVETPMMHPIPGGAAARPFKTHHNALDMELYLRIAPELYLKRLVVGGFERVFEINRNFRNEGISVRHNPEFTMMEFYIAWRDYLHLMQFTEDMFRDIATKVLGKTLVGYQGMEIDFGKPFDRLTMVEAVKKYAPDLANIDFNDAKTLLTHIRANGGTGWQREQSIRSVTQSQFLRRTQHAARINTAHFGGLDFNSGQLRTNQRGRHTHARSHIGRATNNRQRRVICVPRHVDLTHVQAIGVGVFFHSQHFAHHHAIKGRRNGRDTFDFNAAEGEQIRKRSGRERRIDESTQPIL